MDLSNENIIHIKNENIEYLQFKRLLEYKDVIKHAFTLKVHKIDFNPNKLKHIEKESYNKLCKALEIDGKNIVLSRQNHTDNVERVDKVEIKKENYDIQYDNTDGMITNKRNIVLITKEADCIPILMFDTKKKAIANVHSGWKGTTLRISEKAVKKMIKEYNTNPEDLICAIGPSIGKCHFEVDKDVFKIFDEKLREDEALYKRYDDIIIKNKDKYFIDTVLINRIMLEKIGVKPENILESKICTVCESKLLHSYRVDKETSGRNSCVIELL